MWFIGVEVELIQRRLHPLLKKNPGSAPVVDYKVLSFLQRRGDSRRVRKITLSATLKAKN